MGGGLSAIFQIESAIQADSTGGTLAGRETFVGLQGTWGTFKMGGFLAPYDDIHPIFGNVPTLTTSILSTANLWAQGSQNVDNGGFDNRLANSIRYDSPRIGGFTFSAQIGAYDFVAGRWRNHGRYRAQAKRHAYIGVDGRLLLQRPVPGAVSRMNARKGSRSRLNDYAIVGRDELELRYRQDRWRVGAPGLRRPRQQPDAQLLRASARTVPIGPGELYAIYGTAATARCGPLHDDTSWQRSARRWASSPRAAARARPVVDLLHVRAVEADALLRRLSAGAQRQQRGLQLQHQPVHRGQRRQRQRLRDRPGALLLREPYAKSLRTATGAFGRPFFLENVRWRRGSAGRRFARRATASLSCGCYLCRCSPPRSSASTARCAR